MSLLLLVAGALGQFGPAPLPDPPAKAAPLPAIRQSEVVAPAVELQSLTLDELIERLPLIGSEYHWLQVSQRWVTDPLVLEMERRLKSGASLSAAQWQRALTRTGAIRFRPKWPAGRPYVVPMELVGWLPYTVVELTPVDPRLSVLRAGTTLPESCGSLYRVQAELEQQLGMLPRGKHHLEFRVRISGGRDSLAVDWTGNMAFDVEIVETAGDAVPSVGTPEMDAAVRGSLGLLARRWAQGLESVELIFDGNIAACPELATTAVDLDVEALRDGVVQTKTGLFAGPRLGSHGDPWLGCRSVYDGPLGLFSAVKLDDISAERLENPEEVARWTFRFTSGNEDVLAITWAERRWSGTFEMSMAELMQAERERAKKQTAWSHQ